ncbi:MAG: DUF6036 family nucleotidyltransferase [Pseudonocardiaceae bacterium]
MNREQLEHLLRAASQIADDPNVVVLGSQSIPGSFPDTALPDEAIGSIEADLAFFDDEDEVKSNRVDGAIGELAQFHETFGIYGQGVSITTAVMPAGWHDRLEVLDTPATVPGRGLCLERHDLVIAKLVAGREKDYDFAAALLRAGLVEATVLFARTEALDVDQPVRSRVRQWIMAYTEPINPGQS